MTEQKDLKELLANLPSLEDLVKIYLSYHPEVGGEGAEGSIAEHVRREVGAHSVNAPNPLLPTLAQLVDTYVALNPVPKGLALAPVVNGQVRKEILTSLPN